MARAAQITASDATLDSDLGVCRFILTGTEIFRALWLTLWVAACALLKSRVLGRVTAADFLSCDLEFPCLPGFCLFGYGVSP